MLQKTNGFIVEGMSFKPLDRDVVRTKDLMIDGQAYDQFHDPFMLAAKRMWHDISAYEGMDGQQNLGSLKVNVQSL